MLIRVTAVAPQPVLPGLSREVAGILRRNWALALPPAALLGAGADAVLLLHDHLIAEIVVGISLAIAFEMYVGYAELVVARDRGHAPRTGAGPLLRRAMPLTAPLVISSLIAVTLPLAASGLLLIPGLWLLTRWALFAPAIVHEGLGPLDALSRSSTLVRGAFWAVFISVTLSVLVEHAIIHGVAHGAEPALGSTALSLIAAALITALVSAPAAFTISVVYERRIGDLYAGPDAGSVHHRPEDAPTARSS
jgi:hypothetical protein